ncbi:integrase [Gossypium australe]|uniref:Integrase n=1 Tax=Gossypium australe TaxID=47621 RepID=A0A5B6X0D4_9ROSI|nr:integrase [Gossypium australe]
MVVYLFTRGVLKFVLVVGHVSRCLVCQQVKAEHQVPSRLLQPNENGIELRWILYPVVVDQLTKSAHFILVCTEYSLDKLAELYIYAIVRLHAVPVLIILDRDPRFTSKLLKKL